MHLRRALPLSLSLVALLASSGCVCAGPDAAPVPAPPLGSPAPSAAAPDLPPATPRSRALPLGELPEPAPEPVVEPPPERPPARAARPRAAHSAKPPTAPRRGRPPEPAPPRTPRRPAPALRPDELCAAADGATPPSIVDLCIRQYGR
ncbi:hypothetical protein [Streptomyces sp. NPDC097981]|uniref:hypothetical protein n=1 Tax=Streptomyces sp. NPDC097981 TaxID=3155428 RepID=UPI0033300234